MTLNEAQQAAVDSTAALRVVIAGPGSGKTRTMVEAMAKAKGLVAVMTFTNAGANELRTRWLPYETFNMKLAHCGTLHSYCFKLIQRFGGFLGYIPGKVGILPDAERIPRLLAVRDKLGIKISQKDLLAINAIAPTAQLIWKEYEFLLKRNNLVDYDGILRVALELLGLTGEAGLVFRHQVKLDYLFVDEYQDSAQIDQQIYCAIPATNKMFVGDPDQSIFAFRGANPSGMTELAWKIGPTTGGPGRGNSSAEVHKLELNYRSDGDICVAANRLIAHNKERVEKEIVPVSVEKGWAQEFGFEDVSQELAYIAAAIPQRPPDSTIAVLYRMNHDVKVCRDYLRAMGIPITEPKWEQRPPDWERAVLILGLMGSPENEILAERFLKLTRAPAEVDRMLIESRVAGRSLIAHALPQGFGGWSYPDGIERSLAANGVSESTSRLIWERANLLGPDADLSDLLHDLHSGEETKEAQDGTGVYVGTIHSAKGREWDVVFLPAFEQGIIPHVLTTAKNPPPCEGEWRDVEEERRLAFVAVTRARHELYISHCAHRRGPWGPVGQGRPSQFIREMNL